MTSEHQDGPEGLSAVIDDIYDAAIDLEGWLALPKVLADATEAGSGVIAIFDPLGAGETATHGQPAEAGDLYASYYHLVNPLDPIIAQVGPMQARRNQDLMADGAYRQTEFYADFARRYDSHQILGTSIVPIARNVVGHIGVHRSSGRPFRARQAAMLQRLLPHVRRALQLRRRLAGTVRAELGFDALEAFAVGCVVADGAGMIAYANSAASALANSGPLRLGPNGLSAERDQDARQLAALVASAAGGGHGGPLQLWDSNGARCFVLVTAMPRRLGQRPGLALITVREAVSIPAYGTDTLRQLFGLTPAEARLVLALMAGNPLSAISRAYAVSSNTLRSQLSSVLRKTGAASQRDLVGLLMSLPPVRTAD